MNNKAEKKHKFLVQNIFKGLVNEPDDFTPTILYFNEHDFTIVLQRVKEYGIGVYGIEVTLNGEYNGVKVVEDYNTTPEDFRWYTAAFNKLRAKNPDFRYSASYQVQL